MTLGWPDDPEIRRAVATWGQLLDEALLAEGAAAEPCLDWPEDDTVAQVLEHWGRLADASVDAASGRQPEFDLTMAWLGGAAYEDLADLVDPDESGVSASAPAGRSIGPLSEATAGRSIGLPSEAVAGAGMADAGMADAVVTGGVVTGAGVADAGAAGAGVAARRIKADSTVPELAELVSDRVAPSSRRSSGQRWNGVQRWSQVAIVAAVAAVVVLVGGRSANRN